jgi:predicted RNA-binding Zn-ribbon protein involved in translation (DUF1610 family)
MSFIYCTDCGVDITKDTTADVFVSHTCARKIARIERERYLETNCGYCDKEYKYTLSGRVRAHNCTAKKRANKEKEKTNSVDESLPIPTPTSVYTPVTIPAVIIPTKSKRRIHNEQLQDVLLNKENTTLSREDLVRIIIQMDDDLVQIHESIQDNYGY